MNARWRGFTLLEVMVALAVLALSMGAVIQTAGSFTVNQAHLRDRTLAQWVARNQLAMALVRGDWPSVGQSSGEAELPVAGTDIPARAWNWVIQVSQTPDEDLRRLDIRVYPAGVEITKDTAPAALLSGFVANPG
jgi:general secretion pathway protein I